ncbi:alpha/beta fold hydrolase [Saccharopolyspora sp. NPDC002578]
MADPTVVLVPGMLCDAALWAPVEGALGLPVVHARIDAPSITGMAEQVLAAADGPLLVAGLSLGAIVGFEVARLAPHRVAGFAALATNAAAPLPAQHQGWSRMARRTRAGDFAGVVEEVLPSMYSRPSEAAAREFRGMAERIGPRRFLDQLAAQGTRVDARGALGSVRVPSLVVGGVEDALCPPEFHRDIAARLPGCELELVAGAGHLLPLEVPEVIAGLLAGWVRRCAPPAAARGSAAN